MADRSLQGWSGDPYGLHEARYFSGGRPTKLVRDGGVETYDEPPAERPAAAVATAVMVQAGPPDPAPLPSPPGPFEMPAAGYYLPGHAPVAPRRTLSLGLAVLGRLLIAGSIVGVVILKAGGSQAPASSPSPSLNIPPSTYVTQ